MALFRRDKNKGTKNKGTKKGDGGGRKSDAIDPGRESGSVHASRGDPGSAASQTPVEGAEDPAPRRAGLVSSVLSTSAGSDEGEGSPFRSVVERRFGPREIGDSEDGAPTGAGAEESLDLLPPVYREGEDDEESPRLEVDPMAHIGHATTITGNIVAEEDLEIHGAIEGSVRSIDHCLTVGADGVVKATVDAHTVVVFGKITGDVAATDRVEIHAGGFIGGDVRAPRVIMHDGAIVVGGLDMSAALPSAASVSESGPSSFSRPQLIKLDPDENHSSDESGL